MGILTSFLDAKVDRSPTSDFWYQPVGGISKSGVTINTERALKISAVLQGVRFLSQTVAQLPKFIFRHGTDGRSRTKDTKHRLNRFIRFQPNPWQTAFQFHEMMTANAMLKGIGLAEKREENGQLTAILPLEPSRLIAIEQRANGLLRYIYRRLDGQRRTILQEETLSLIGFGIDDKRGLPLVEQMTETAGLAIAMESYGASLFANSAMPRVVLTSPGRIGSDTRARMKADWDSSYGGDARHGTALLEDGTKIDVLSTTNDEAQFIESRKFLIAEFSRHLDVTPHRLSDLEKSSFNNVEQMSLETVVYSLTPWVKRWEQSYHRDLLTQEEQEQDVFVEFMLDGLLRGDTTARADFYAKSINNGWMTRNEVREKENLNPIEGLDEPLQPLNMMTVSQVEAKMKAEAAAEKRAETQAKEKSEAAEAAKLAPPAPLPVPGDADERAVALAYASAQRIIRREEQAVAKWAERKDGNWEEQVDAFYRDYAQPVADALAISIERARQWCLERRESIRYGSAQNEKWHLKGIERLVTEALRK